jgi:hypothetical protein
MRACKRLLALAALLWLAAVLLGATIAASPRLRFIASGADARASRLAATPAPCRVFLVGSSMVAFGLSAAELAARTGCAAANLGVHGIREQIGPYLDQVATHLRPGDTVVLNDRAWTDPGVNQGPCANRPAWRCFIASLHVAPNAQENFSQFTGLGLARNPLGDVVEFPPPATRPHPLTDWSAGDADEAIRLVTAQVATIRARGARVVLAVAPILIDESARVTLAARHAEFAARVRARAGDVVWVEPLLLTDTAAFTLDGLHPSQLGRRGWTGQVVGVVAGK